MTNDIKRDMKKKAHLIRGLVNLLKDDAEYICTDTDDLDLIALGESLHEVKDTIQRVIDNVMELEYSLYLIKQDEPQ